MALPSGLIPSELCLDVRKELDSASRLILSIAAGLCALTV